MKGKVIIMANIILAISLIILYFVMMFPCFIVGVLFFIEHAIIFNIFMMVCGFVIAYTLTKFYRERA